MKHLGIDITKNKELKERFISYLRIKFANEEKYVKKVHNTLSAMTEDELMTFAKSFVKWESKIVDRLYKAGIDGNSRLFQSFVKAATRLGTDVSEFEEDTSFLGGAYEYLGFKVCIYVGQGSYYKIYRGNETVF